MSAVIISGFPGVGKTFLCKNNTTLKISDSDSSKFSWKDDTQTERHPDFPNNYMTYIKDNLDKFDVILVSSHKVVRDALVAAQLNYVLVYPYSECKLTYISRYKARGSSPSFINFITSNWDKFMDDLAKQTHCIHYRLSSKATLQDEIDGILGLVKEINGDD